MKRRLVGLLALLILGFAGAVWYTTARPLSSSSPASSPPTTSRQPADRRAAREAAVTEGDTVKSDQIVAIIAPDELRGSRALRPHNAQGLSSQVAREPKRRCVRAAADAEQIRQAESTLAAAEAQQAAAVADLENARLTLDRTADWRIEGVGRHDSSMRRARRTRPRSAASTR